MPMVVNRRLLSNREPLGKMKMPQLKSYQKVLEKFMVSNSPMVAMTLKQIYQEIEWRHAENPDTKARARKMG